MSRIGCRLHVQLVIYVHIYIYTYVFFYDMLLTSSIFGNSWQHWLSLRAPPRDTNRATGAAGAKMLVRLRYESPGSWKFFNSQSSFWLIPNMSVYMSIYVIYIYMSYVYMSCMYIYIYNICVWYMVVFQDGVRTLKAYRNKKNKKTCISPCSCWEW